MNTNRDKQLAQRMLKTDRPIRFDAAQITSNLVRLKRQKRNSARIGLAAGAIFSVAIFTAIIQLNRSSNIPQSASTLSTENDRLSLTPTDFSLPFVSMEERDKLERLKASVENLTRQYKAQKLTFVKETLSQSFFEEEVPPQNNFN